MHFGTGGELGTRLYENDPARFSEDDQAFLGFTVRKVWQILGTLAALVILFWPAVQRAVPGSLWIVLFTASLTYGISLTLGSRLPIHCRLGVAYLALVAFAYVLGGVLGLLPNWDLIEASMWGQLLVSPYLLFSFLEQLIHGFPYTAARAPYEILPVSPHRLYSAVIVATGAIGVVAAFGLARGNELAQRVWIALLGASAVSLLGYVIVVAVSWGWKEMIVPLCLVTSYLSGFLIIRQGWVSGRPGSPQ